MTITNLFGELANDLSIKSLIQRLSKFSFDTFSHQKAIMKTPTWFDPSVKYPPFKGKLRLFKWVIR